jgi:hypothetical protein
MAGRGPAIHVFAAIRRKDMGARAKPGMTERGSRSKQKEGAGQTLMPLVSGLLILNMSRAWRASIKYQDKRLNGTNHRNRKT